MRRASSFRRGPTRSVGAARVWPLPLAMASLLIVGGCSGPVMVNEPMGESVSGTVTWQGKPLPLGTISFVPATGEEVSGTKTLITNGRYEFPNPPGLSAGSYKVKIESKGKSKTTGPVSEAPRGVPDFRPINPDEPEQIPEKYNDETTLTAEVVAGSNAKNFDLTGTRSPSRGRSPAGRPADNRRDPM
jgi:hypothetical protein